MAERPKGIISPEEQIRAGEAHQLKNVPKFNPLSGGNGRSETIEIGTTGTPWCTAVPNTCRGNFGFGASVDKILT